MADSGGGGKVGRAVDSSSPPVDKRKIDFGREGDDGGNEPWFVYVFVCVLRD
jgi:hypothetical protein